MKSLSKRKKVDLTMKNKKLQGALIATSIILSIVIAIGIWMLVDESHPFHAYLGTSPITENNNENNSINNENTNDDSIHNEQNNESGEEEEKEEEEPEPEPEPDEIKSLSIAVAGDIMFHSPQVADKYYDSEKDRYDFSSFFVDVAPYFKDADLSIANFETTTAGPSIEYTGYPAFNTPDEAIEDIQNAGLDVLITANNHSLDTGSDGLKRTAEMMKKFKMDHVGTYDKPPEDSRFLLKEVNGLKVVILAYTESTNGIGDQFDKETLDGMINMMDKEQIVQDIQDAKDAEADLIISYMHWGVEYADEPNDTQLEFAQLLADEGVHIIFGSHPHVIQKSDFIQTETFDTFVIYSLGNFISNQRRETLGDEFQATEDGVIVQLEVEKNMTQDELEIKSVDYLPTWVSRTGSDGDYEYRILPIDDFINNEEYESVQGKLQNSYDSTTSKLEATVPVN